MPEPRVDATFREHGDLREIWSPIDVGAVTLRNRIAVPPISVRYHGADRFISDRHIGYYAERARGGVGLITTEQQLVDSQTEFRPSTLIAYDERAIPGFARAAETVHEHGAKMFVELLAPGAWDGATTLDGWHVNRGPSAMFIAPRVGEYVRALDQTDIDRLLTDYARSARNVQRGGLDGVEVHGAHGYLPQQFMSPVLNRRRDRYGGSLRNRAQFAIEVAEAIRGAVGDGLAVGIRLSIDEFQGPGNGVCEEEMLEIIDAIADQRLYDFFDISCGGLSLMHLTIAPMNVADGFLLPQGKAVKAVVGDRAKVFVVGRIRGLDLAERALCEGAADVVCMARAHLADPLLVQKERDGRADEIIRCVGANACSGGGPGTEQGVNCMLNPATGREYAAPWARHARAAPSRTVVVVGGGPAGLKLAGVAARRGHAVTLIERDCELGGHLNDIRRLPTRGPWRMAVDDLAWVARKHGAEIRLGAEATAAALREHAAEVIVCATGSHWRVPERSDEGDAPARVDIGSAIRSAAEDPSCLGGHVVIVDEVGGYLALGLAEMLAIGGCRVAVITSRSLLGSGLAESGDAPYLMPRLVALGVELSSQTTMSLTSAGLTAASVWGGPSRLVEGVSTVVYALPKVPNDELFNELRDVAAEVHLIGDALSPRHTRFAIYEGELLARAL